MIFEEILNTIKKFIKKIFYLIFFALKKFCEYVKRCYFRAQELAQKCVRKMQEWIESQPFLTRLYYTITRKLDKERKRFLGFVIKTALETGEFSTVYGVADTKERSVTEAFEVRSQEIDPQIKGVCDLKDGVPTVLSPEVIALTS